MPRFRTRPTVIIEAEQFLPPNEVPAGVLLFGRDDGCPLFWKDDQGCRYPARAYVDGFIPWREGTHHCIPGDWIITGVNEGKYPCKEGIFCMTYELADEPGLLPGDLSWPGEPIPGWGD